MIELLAGLLVLGALALGVARAAFLLGPVGAARRRAQAELDALRRGLRAAGTREDERRAAFLAAVRAAPAGRALDDPASAALARAGCLAVAERRDVEPLRDALAARVRPALARADALAREAGFGAWLSRPDRRAAVAGALDGWCAEARALRDELRALAAAEGALQELGDRLAAADEAGAGLAELAALARADRRDVERAIAAARDALAH